MTNPTILVLGAGVVGLTSALELKKKFPSINITVAGQYIPGDIDISYTSPFAGANWHTFSEDDDLQLQEYDKPGYHKFLELANDPKSGIWIKKSYSMFTKELYEEENKDDSKFLKWYRNFVEDFQILQENELPDGVALGFSFKGVVISTPIYLSYLLQKCLESGVIIKRTQYIKSIHEAKKRFQADLVINCTGGNGSKIIGVSDPNQNYPVKGQVLLVSNNAPVKMSVSTFTPDYPDELFYLMPRKEGGCIIGGLMTKDVSKLEEDKALTQRIIQRAIKYMPQLIDPNYENNPDYIDIVKVNVGLRPSREGGPRVENDSTIPWLIHNYGAGGGGYQGSYGFAHKVVKLVTKKLNSKL